MTMPTIDHPTNRANFAIVEVNGTSYAFSYKTLIAFRSAGPWRARVNVWGPTTGKHLNALDPASLLSERVDETEFARLLALHEREQRLQDRTGSTTGLMGRSTTDHERTD